jgi:hypothetical protein
MSPQKKRRRWHARAIETGSSRLSSVECEFASTCRSRLTVHCQQARRRILAFPKKLLFGLAVLEDLADQVEMTHGVGGPVGWKAQSLSSVLAAFDTKK